MVRVASHVAIAAEQWRQGAPQQRRRATALIEATNPVLLVLGAVQIAAALCCWQAINESMLPNFTNVNNPNKQYTALFVIPNCHINFMFCLSPDVT